MSRLPLHGDALLRALSEVATALPRANTTGVLLRAMGEGLSSVGLNAVVVQWDGAALRVRSLNFFGIKPEENAFVHQLSGVEVPRAAYDSLITSQNENRPVLVSDVIALAERVFEARFPDAVSAVKDAIASVGFLRAVVIALGGPLQPWGGLVIGADDLNDDDMPALQLFALHANAALETAKTIADLESRNRELQAINTLAQANSGEGLEQMSALLLESLGSALRCDAVSLSRWDAREQHYLLVGTSYRNQELVHRYRLFRPEPNWHQDAPWQFHVRSVEETQVLAAEGLEYMAVAPITLGGRSLGFVTLARKQPEPFSDKELGLAQRLCTQIGGIIERVNLYEHLRLSYAQLEAAQSELVRHERLAALGEIAAVVAHEVRNPLGVMFNVLSSLRRIVPADGDAAQLLALMREEADRLNRIVADLLDLARPFTPDPKPVLLMPIAHAAAASARQAVPHSSASVHIESESEALCVLADPHLLRQALVNLYANGLHAMTGGGQLTVSARTLTDAGKNWVRIDIQDQGVGMTQDTQARIFQPFFTTKAMGTGLGLAIVKRIVDAHSGSLRFESEVGKGTCFTVQLPAA